MNDDEFKKIASIYTDEQYHQSLKDFLIQHIAKESGSNGCRMQVSCLAMANIRWHSVTRQFGCGV